MQQQKTNTEIDGETHPFSFYPHMPEVDFFLGECEEEEGKLDLVHFLLFWVSFPRRGQTLFFCLFVCHWCGELIMAGSALSRECP